MIFRIYEEDLIYAGFPLNTELELSAKIVEDHMLVIGSEGEIPIRIYPENKEHKVEIPEDIVNKIQFEDSTYEHPCPAYIHVDQGEIGLIFP